MPGAGATATPPTVVVLDDWERATTCAPGWRDLRERVDLQVHPQRLAPTALREALRPARALVLNRDRTPLTRELLAHMPALEIVVHTGPRNLRIDRAALAERGIPVAGTEGGPARESTCEQTWALILAAGRRLASQWQWVRSGSWRSDDPGAAPRALHGRRIGIIGLGEIGTQVAAVAHAFGMEVVAWSPHLTPERARRAGASWLPLEELLRTSDVVTLHLVASDETAGLLDAARLALMRPDALLVNTSRPGLVVQEDLVAALRSGRPGAVALDVHPHEPLSPDDPLLALPNACLTPHMGFVSEEVLRVFSEGVERRLRAWLQQRT